MKYRGASLIVLVFIVASVSGKTDRISGGTETEAENVPYQAAVVEAGTTKLRCGGVLIRPNFVLTSAYCARLGNATNTQVMFGNKNLTTSSPSQNVNVQDIRIHEENEPLSRKNDIALLKLSYELNIPQPAVDTIKIRQSEFPSTAICTLSGWGSTEWNGVPPGVLQILKLSAVDYVMCSWILKQKIEVRQLCAGGKEGENACFLDEGNPLVCGGELAGIVSQSLSCGVNMTVSVYTDVYKYSDWIESTIESMNSAAVSTLNSFVTMAMPVGLISYWKCIQ